MKIGDDWAPSCSRTSPSGHGGRRVCLGPEISGFSLPQPHHEPICPPAPGWGGWVVGVRLSLSGMPIPSEAGCGPELPLFPQSPNCCWPGEKGW